MNEDAVRKIFAHHQLGDVQNVCKMSIGFTNTVFVADDKWILKLCTDEYNEINFAKEQYLYDHFRSVLPVPRVHIYDDTKKVSEHIFMVYRKIDGVPLYSVWHTLNVDDRKKLVQQLSDMLRTIRSTSYKEFASKFNIPNPVVWQDTILNRIATSLTSIQSAGLLTEGVIREIKTWIDQHSNLLEEQKLGLVHWDAHFDNILVRDNTIVGLLDLERTVIASIDYTLDIFKRMVDYPTKYMSDESEQYAKREDYALLLTWFREFSPELFAFEQIEQRLLFYALEHDLRTLAQWPESEDVKSMLDGTLNATRM